MKAITWAQLKIKPVGDLVKGECYKITTVGPQSLYLIVNPQQVMRDRVEAICRQIDASRGY